MFKLSPSILSANFSNLGEDIKKVEVKGVDCLHIDVMDGHFVPNITIGAPVVKSIKKTTKLPLDVHIMVKEPEKFVDQFIEAGADMLTFHVEATKHPERLLRYIQSKGVKAGISLNPATDISTIKFLYGAFDLVLVMTVNPGFGGQKLISSVLDKVKELKKIKQEKKLDFIIELDGGVNEENIKSCTDAGAELIVAGNAIFGSADPLKAIQNLLAKGA